MRLAHFGVINTQPFNKTKRMRFWLNGGTCSNHWNIIFQSLKSDEDNTISLLGRKGSLYGLIVNVLLIVIENECCYIFGLDDRMIWFACSLADFQQSMKVNLTGFINWDRSGPRKFQRAYRAIHKVLFTSIRIQMLYIYIYIAHLLFLLSPNYKI